MSSSKQNAGANSNQIIVHGDYVQGVVTEDRVREIAAEFLEESIQQYTIEAQTLAGDRIHKFDDLLVQRLAELDLLQAFKDPNFQFSLKKAQIGAASSEDEDDLHLLSELLVDRVQRSPKRPVRAGIDLAIDVIDKIDPDALRGLTMVQVASRVTATSGSVEHGLDVIARAYAPILADGDLPLGRDWIDHLDILDALRNIWLTNTRKFADIFTATLNGYIASGVAMDSPEEQEGHRRLVELGTLPDFRSHELKQGYHRLPFPSLTQMEQSLGQQFPQLGEGQRADVMRIAREIFGMSDIGDPELKPALMERALARPEIRAVAEWWDQIPGHIRATSVGMVLARANAQRCDPQGAIPDLIV